MHNGKWNVSKTKRLWQLRTLSEDHIETHKTFAPLRTLSTRRRKNLRRSAIRVRAVRECTVGRSLWHVTCATSAAWRRTFRAPIAGTCPNGTTNSWGTSAEPIRTLHRTCP
uniref:(northern house mosquito) hypothetical protein n=1 Tax=Culex pipiens TaxID=7175 RepID=A0A8D8MJE6_CULPI